MTQQPALAGLHAAMKLRLEEFDTAIAKLDGTKRGDPGYGELFEARWEAAEAYEKAYDAWNEEIEKEVA
ncbi:hypothetical protein [Arthrobacter sp. MYb213]|uniref:hypothetical protein n=1 Tax=Arthrobacter sp. MYb213 TaxID=1848595 RepID=UPI000CFAF611|nr:hypothetical protein [Arthrobacter sp. MYb213]PRB69489.1 hypothetical protein CQ011_12060 [Arthrobacter sp. MYb213]